jgi:hypothetical protein
MSSGCADSSFCRGGCCRSFLGTEFCDVESNCIDNPTWLVALVPALLGVAALILVILVCIRLKNRKIIDLYDKKAALKHEYLFINN